MKQVILLCAFMLTAGFVGAQDTKAKKCCASKKACTKSNASASTDSETKVASALSSADLAADEDKSIEKRVCDITGSVAYFKKSVCEKSGSVKMDEVTFDEESMAFVNVSPIDAMNDKEATAVKASAKSADAVGKKKACCAGKKACSKKKTGV